MTEQAKRSQSKYHDALTSIPAPGSGCHVALLSVANIGIIAGVDPETLFDDIRANIPKGNRHIPNKEISDAVNKALSEHDRGVFVPKPRPDSLVKDNEAAWDIIRRLAPITTESDLIATSPVKLDGEPGNGGLLKSFFYGMFKPDDLLFIGDRTEPGIMGKTIRMAIDWLNDLCNGEMAGPFIIINPLSGDDAPKKTGDGATKRGDGNVKNFRYCLVEFDGRTREDQISFWSWIIVKGLPVVCLIDSGNKSIHGWLDVQRMASVKTLDDWATKIKTEFYDGILRGLGVDAACSNPARLSRLPGYFREDKGKFQRLLWLAKGEPL
jgi:hypothetical protein